MFHKLLLASLVCISLSLQASRLSRVTEKVSRPLQQAVAVLACAAATCFVGIKAEAYDAKVKELSFGTGYHYYDLFASGKMLLFDNGGSYYNEASIGYLHGQAALWQHRNKDDWGNSRTDSRADLRILNAYLLYFYGTPGGKTYSQGGGDVLVLTAVGFDRHDMRGFELGDDTEAFAVKHLHGIGFESPIISSKVGIGDLGLVETGTFQQADLEEWAGDGADFSYLFFLTNSIGGTVRQSSNGSRSHVTRLSFKIEQMRTLSGDIDFADGTDGDFSAIWESFKVEFGLSNKDHYNQRVLHELIIDWSAFRQRLAASAGGRSFSQNKIGLRVGLRVTSYLD